MLEQDVDITLKAWLADANRLETNLLAYSR